MLQTFKRKFVSHKYLVCLVFVFTMLFVTFIEDNLLKYILGSVLFLTASIFTLYNLNKRLDFKTFINENFKNNFNTLFFYILIF